MNTRHADDLRSKARSLSFTDEVWDAVADRLTNARKLYSSATHAFTDATTACEELFTVMSKGGRVINKKLVMNASMNIEAAFEAAEALVRCKNPMQTAATQAELARDLFTRSVEQLQEMSELAAEVTMHIGDALINTTSKCTVPECLITNNEARFLSFPLRDTAA